MKGRWLRLRAMGAALLGAGIGCSTHGAIRPAASPPAVDAAVSTLIEQAVSATTQGEQQASFEKLERLGCEAVPSLVRHLDDERRLPVQYLALPNDFPGAFEAFRQYGPEVVADALAALLNQITGKEFGFISNGATPAERRGVVAKWRQWLERVAPENICWRFTVSGG